MHFPQSQNTMAPPLYRSAFSAKHVSSRHRSFSFWQLMNHFLLALVSQFHVLHFFVFLLLLDFVSLLLIVLVLAQSFSSQFLNLLAFLLLLSLRIPYSPFLLSLLLLLIVLHLLFFFQHFLRLLSPFPELQPLLAPLLFSEPASLILLYVIFQHFLLLLSHQVSVFLLQVSAFPLFLLVHASLHVFVSLHPVSSSSSFALYFPLSSVD